MTENPLQRAKRLIDQPDLCIGTHELRVFLRQLVVQIEARDAAIEEGCVGEYCDVALIHHVRALIGKHAERLSAASLMNATVR